MKKILLVFLSIFGLLFTGCSNVKRVKVKEETVITKAEKGVFLQVNETDISSKLHEYFSDKKWKVFESKDVQYAEISKPTNDAVTEAEKKSKKEEVVVLKPVFEVKYSIETHRNRGFGDDTYSGFITVVDMRTGELVTSIRFKDAEENEIIDEFEDEFGDNIKIQK